MTGCNIYLISLCWIQRVQRKREENCLSSWMDSTRVELNTPISAVDPPNEEFVMQGSSLVGERQAAFS
jgi:hypothetical protein